MTAKKTAARKPTAAKSAKELPSARKVRAAAKPAAAKAPAKAKAPVKAEAQPVIKTDVKKAPAAKAKAAAKPQTAKAAPATSNPVKAEVGKTEAGKAAPAKKTAAAPARAKRSPSKAFDPDRRRDMIAAAAARRRKTVTARPAVSPIVVIKPREASEIERHRFSVGDEVRVVSTSGMWFKHGIEFRITAALPPQGGKLQYRIKNEQEPYERVVSESQLAAAQM